MLTAGQRHDITCAEALTSGYNSEYVIADTSYDSMAFIESITDRGAVPVIPPRANRRDSRTYDVHLYRERHLVEFVALTKSSSIGVFPLVLIS